MRNNSYDIKRKVYGCMTGKEEDIKDYKALVKSDVPEYRAEAQKIKTKLINVWGMTEEEIEEAVK
jgi:hypothetical protein